MVLSSIKATIPCSIQQVWKTVTSLENCKWRSDLSSIDVLNNTQFIEYTKDGYPTTFTITTVKPYEQWEFDMNNTNMSGHWIGTFTQIGKETEIEFTEDITPKKLIMKPFVKSYLKRQQALCVADLKKALIK